MIYYWPGASDHAAPSGGVKTHYRHVDILNAAGIPARILHMTPGFRCEWFAHDTPIVYAPTTELGPGDVLVMNEILGPSTAAIAPGIRKVIFCQNIHYAWRNWPIPIPPDGVLPYRHPEIVGSLVLTAYERHQLEWAFPEHRVRVVEHGIDPARFPLGTAKTRQIAYMPRKHADEAQAVFGWLRATGALDGWTVVAIHDKSEAETAAILQAARVFFAFGYPEGGTIPPFEALASGCVVLGYGGFASDDLLRDCGGRVVPSGDSCTFARRADALLRHTDAVLDAEGHQGHARVLARLPMAAERDALLSTVQAWGLA